MKVVLIKDYDKCRLNLCLLTGDSKNTIYYLSVAKGDPLYAAIPLLTDIESFNRLTNQKNVKVEELDWKINDIREFSLRAFKYLKTSSLPCEE